MLILERTKNNKKMVLNLALSYSGRWELLEAIKKISNLSTKGKLASDEIDEKLISSFLTTKRYS